MNPLEDLKKALKAYEAQAFQLNYTIADDPELSGEEYHACRHYVDLCRSLGMDVEEQFTGQPTAFRAIAHRADKPVFKMALLAEYDALPGVGHGCGHSANGAMSFLAAAALKDLKDLPVDVDLIGTPDEELRGGKVIHNHGIRPGSGNSAHGIGQAAQLGGVNQRVQGHMHRNPAGMTKTDGFAQGIRVKVPSAAPRIVAIQPKIYGVSPGKHRSPQHISIAGGGQDLRAL